MNKPTSYLDVLVKLSVIVRNVGPTVVLLLQANGAG